MYVFHSYQSKLTCEITCHSITRVLNGIGGVGGRVRGKGVVFHIPNLIVPAYVLPKSDSPS